MIFLALVSFWLAFIRLYDTWRCAKYHVDAEKVDATTCHYKCFLVVTMPNFALQSFDSNFLLSNQKKTLLHVRNCHIGNFTFSMTIINYFEEYNGLRTKFAPNKYLIVQKIPSIYTVSTASTAYTIVLLILLTLFSQ